MDKERLNEFTGKLVDEILDEEHLESVPLTRRQMLRLLRLLRPVAKRLRILHERCEALEELHLPESEELPKKKRFSWPWKLGR